MKVDLNGYSSPRWSNEYLDCSMPMTFDQYSDCSYRCAYCFSQYTRGIGIGKSGYKEGVLKTANPERVKRLFRGEIQSLGKDKSGFWQFNDYIRAGKTMQWGGLSDPFCYYERKYGIGLELMRFFRDIEYQVSFSTKGTWWLDDPRYFSCFAGNPNYHVKVSIITGDENKAKAIERGVPSVKDRLLAIERLARAMPEGAVTLRFRPFIIGVSNPGHKELIRDAANAGASSVSTEFFCVESRSARVAKENYARISDVTGYNVLKFYRSHSTYSSGYMRLNRGIKRRYVNEMEEAARNAGIRFYVSDAHYKERSDNGCCCGMPESWNYSRGHFLEAMLIAKKKGRVHFSDIEDGMKHFKLVPWRRAEGMNTANEEKRALFYRSSIADLIRWHWNTPNTRNSPYLAYQGILRPVDTDDNGDVIYEYDNERGGR